MHFHIDEDKGDFVMGWLLPDNPSQEPRIVAEADGRRVPVPIGHTHQAMVDSGMHDTGRVGFLLNEGVMPGLTKARGLRLVDQDTGIVIYARREPRAYVEERLFAFEMREGADGYCTAMFAPAFHMVFLDIHQFGQDTRKSCFNVKFSPSVYVGGAICLRADDPFMVQMDFRRIALLADPAELLMDAVMPGHPKDDPGAPALLGQFCAGLDARDREALNDPLTRRLTSLYVGEPLERDAVARALYALSDFEAVGVETALADFAAVVAAVCEVDERSFARPAQPPPFALARACREEEEIVRLLGRDFQVYDSVHDAVLAARLTQSAA